MSESILKMKLLKGNYGVCRFNKDEDIPEWSLTCGFFSITRTEDELSIVCEEESIPDAINCERNWRILKILGPLDFSLVGILASISKVLADCGISIFAISTFDTDYILVKEDMINKTVVSLKKSGYMVVE